jgi:hypothetical protein
MAATTPQGRLQGKNAIITGAGGYVPSPFSQQSPSIYSILLIIEKRR